MFNGANYTRNEKTGEQMQPVVMVCKVSYVCFISQMVHIWIWLPFHGIVFWQLRVERRDKCLIGRLFAKHANRFIDVRLSQTQKHFPNSSVIRKVGIIVQPCVSLWPNIWGTLRKQNKLEEVKCVIITDFAKLYKFVESRQYGLTQPRPQGQTLMSFKNYLFSKVVQPKPWGWLELKQSKRNPSLRWDNFSDAYHPQDKSIENKQNWDRYKICTII